LGIEQLKLKYNKQLEDLCSLTQEIIGERIEPYDGHSCDFIYSGNDYGVDELLRKTKIEIKNV
jgi:hypothetical protein